LGAFGFKIFKSDDEGQKLFFIQRDKTAGFYANFENCGKNCENFTQKRQEYFVD
jgi:hypothetical protein